MPQLTHSPGSPLFRAARLGQTSRLRLTLQLGLTFILLVTALGARPGPAAQAGPSPAVPPVSATQADAAFGQLPLYFVENHGQVDRRAAYYVQGRDKAIYFTADGVWYAFSGGAAQHWLRLDFLGAQQARPAGQDQTEAIVSYFKGAPGEWQAGLPTYAGVVYRDLWPGIDLTYRGTTNRLKYEFLVRPGADPADIRLAYRGASSVVLNPQGQLEVETPLGGFVDERPTAYQVRGGEIEPVPAAFDLSPLPEGDEISYRYGFRLGEYDRSLPLVIDPASLVYAGYIGGAGHDVGYGIAVDGAGNVYGTGHAGSDQASFPDGDGFGTLTGFDTTFNGGSYDAFVAKVNAAGTALVYASYIGGSGNEEGYGIAVDGAGNAYITGLTSSDQASFPVSVGPDLTYNGGADAFVAKLNADGTALDYAGYIGGAGGEFGRGIALDGAGNAYLTGWTYSGQASFPDGDGFGALTSFDNTFNGYSDGFVTKVNAAGSALDYAGYIGGINEDNSYGIAVDGAGNAYVAGRTASTQITFAVTAGPDLTFNGGQYDAFVAKVNAAGSALAYAGYIGGSSNEDYAYGIAVDGAGNAYVAGQTSSNQASFPDGDGFGALTSFDNTYNGVSFEAYAAKLNPAGTALVYAGYIGGANGDTGFGIAVDGAGNAYVAGTTTSSQATFPDGDGFGTLTSFDNTLNGVAAGSGDAFVTRVNAAGTALNYAGYIGGGGGDAAFGIALDGAANAYVAGVTESGQASFPDGDGFGMLTSFDNTYNGGSYDAFVAKVSFSNTPPVASPDTYATDEDTPLAVAAPGVLGNDADADNDPLAAVKESDPLTGTLALNASGSLVYTPTLNFNGVVTFAYHAGDAVTSSNTAVVTLTVNAVNDAPTPANDSLSTAEDTPLTFPAGNLVANDSPGPADESGQTLTVSVVSTATHGSVSLNGGDISYTPDGDYYGSDSFTYTVCDDGTTHGGPDSRCGVATVDVAVGPVNDEPVANVDSYSTPEDTPLTVAAPGVVGDDTDADNDSLVAVKDSDPLSGTLALDPDGSLVYTPTLNYNGVVTFTYHASDGLASSNTAVVTLTVNPVNDAPTLSDIPDQQVEECDTLGPIFFTVGDVDSDVDSLDLSAASSDPALAPVSSIGFGGGGANRSLIITPTLGLTGTAAISITVGDGTDSSSDAFLLTVNPRTCYFHLPIVVKNHGLRRTWWWTAPLPPEAR